MKGSLPNQIEEPKDPANLDAEELASNQRAVVVPWHVGEAKVAAKWISPTFAQYTQAAPAERGGKK